MSTTARNSTTGIERALHATLISQNVADSNLEPANVVDVLDKIARCIGFATGWSGKADATKPEGSIELHAMAIREAGSEIASAIDRLASAISEAGP